MEVLVAPDVEAAVVSWLRGALGSRGVVAAVATRVPDTMPASMVRVSLTGGTRRDVVTDRPQLTVECWSGNSVDAGGLARLVHALMHSVSGETVAGLWVRAVDEVGGVQSLPDPDTNKPRYQFTVRWHVRPVSI